MRARIDEREPDEMKKKKKKRDLTSLLMYDFVGMKRCIEVARTCAEDDESSTKPPTQPLPGDYGTCLLVTKYLS